MPYNVGYAIYQYGRFSGAGSRQDQQRSSDLEYRLFLRVIHAGKFFLKNIPAQREYFFLSCFHVADSPDISDSLPK